MCFSKPSYLIITCISFFLPAQAAQEAERPIPNTLFLKLFRRDATTHNITDEQIHKLKNIEENIKSFAIPLQMCEILKRPLEFNKLHDSEKIHSLSISNDDKTLVGSSWDRSIIWDIHSGKIKNTFSSGIDLITSIAISPDNKNIFTGSWNGKIKIWNIDTGKELRTLANHHNSIYSLTLSPCSTKVIAISSDNKSTIWHIDSGQKIHTLLGQEDDIKMAAINHDGTCLVTGSENGAATIWNDDYNSKLHILGPHKDTLTALTISSDGRIIITGSRDGATKIWSTLSGKLIHAFWGNNYGVNAIATSPDNKQIIIGKWDGSITLWDLLSGTETYTIKGNFLDSVNAITISHDGNHAIVSTNNNIEVYPATRALPELLKHISLAGVQLLNNIINGATGTIKHPFTKQQQIEFNALPEYARSGLKKKYQLHEYVSVCMLC